MQLFSSAEPTINRCFFGDSSRNYKAAAGRNLLTSVEPIRLNGERLVRLLYEHAEERYVAFSSVSPRLPSTENWRFKRRVTISDGNKSPEKQVEKAIARLADSGVLNGDQWANQVPVASGLLGAYCDKKACIDLVFKAGSGSYEFIELKMSPGSGHALWAAVENLCYAVTYLLSRHYEDKLGYLSLESDLIRASSIRLVVLAPYAYYDRLSKDRLSDLSQAFSDGLSCQRHLIGLAGPEFQVAFEAFPNTFNWPCDSQALARHVLERKSVLPT